MGKPKMATPAERQQWRFDFLRELYEATGSNTSVSVVFSAIAASAEIPPREWDSVESYLRDRGLIERRGSGEQTSITADGVDALEAKLDAPDAPTGALPFAVSVTHHHTYNGPVGAVQHGDDNTATVTQSISSQGAELLAMLAELRAARGEIAPERARAFDAAVTSLEREARSESPDGGMIEMVKPSIEQMIADTPQLVELWQRIVPFLVAMCATG